MKILNINEKENLNEENMEIEKGKVSGWQFNSRKTNIELLDGEGFIEIQGKKKKVELKNEKGKKKCIVKKYQFFRIESTETSEIKIKIVPKDSLVLIDEKRHYDTTPLKTKVNNERSDFVFKLYSEVNSNYRHLAEIRFKLLGLVPAISIIAWATLIEKISTTDISTNILGIIICILALRTIWGIRIYDKRNDELYNDLISRGRKIESELKLLNGIFLGRVRPTKIGSFFGTFRNGINHSTGTNLIYTSVEWGWIGILIYYFGNLGLLVYPILLKNFMILKSWL